MVQRSYVWYSMSVSWLLAKALCFMLRGLGWMPTPHSFHSSLPLGLVV